MAAVNARGARRLRRGWVGAVVVVGLALTGCSGGGSDSGDGSGGKPAGKAAPQDPGSAAPAAAPAAVLTITPGDGGVLAPGEPVTVKVEGGKIGAVTVTGEDGSEIAGDTADDLASWRSTGALHTATRYTVKASATNTAGQQAQATAAFRTEQADKKVRYQVNVADGRQIGVGLPISVVFDSPVKNREAVEKALSVVADTPVTGAWRWVKDRNLNDGQRIDFRPKDYWKPGTKITFKADLDGVDIGDGRFTIRDSEAKVTVARSLVATVDVKTHQMTVVEDGKPDTVIPITAGAPGMDTWNGTMVVMDRNSSVLMDGQTVGYGGQYRDYYNWALHTTASGTYVHENASANVNAGKKNVTHGCVGLANDGTAKKFYDRVIVGDVIKVVNSASETVDVGNGYGDWNLSWEQWTSGDAAVAAAAG
ncbi:Ig-like domain-containing protein [Streptodolium elevatio]